MRAVNRVKFRIMGPFTPLLESSLKYRLMVLAALEGPGRAFKRVLIGAHDAVEVKECVDPLLVLLCYFFEVVVDGRQLFVAASLPLTLECLLSPWACLLVPSERAWRR